MKKLNIITILLAVFIVLMGCKKECTFVYSKWTQCSNKIQTRRDRPLIKEVINSALLEAVDKHEKKHGSIKPIPKK